MLLDEIMSRNCKILSFDKMQVARCLSFELSNLTCINSHSVFRLQQLQYSGYDRRGATSTGDRGEHEGVGS